MIFVLTAYNLFPSGGNDTVHYDRHKRGRLGTKAPNLAITTHATISGGRIKGGIVALADRRVGRLTRRRRRWGSRWTYRPCTYACSLARLGRYYHGPFGINFLSSFPERAVVLGSDNQRAGDAVSGRVSVAR